MVCYNYVLSKKARPRAFAGFPGNFMGVVSTEEVLEFHDLYRANSGNLLRVLGLLVLANCPAGIIHIAIIDLLVIF